MRGRCRNFQGGASYVAKSNTLRKHNKWEVSPDVGGGYMGDGSFLAVAYRNINRYESFGFST